MMEYHRDGCLVDMMETDGKIYRPVSPASYPDATEGEGTGAGPTNERQESEERMADSSGHLDFYATAGSSPPPVPPASYVCAAMRCRNLIVPPWPPKRGRPKRFCSEACRKAKTRLVPPARLTIDAKPGRTRTVIRYLSPRTRPEPLKAGDREFVMFVCPSTYPKPFPSRRVRAADPTTIGRAFSDAAVQLALGTYPGAHLTAPPSDAVPYGVFTAGYVPQGRVPHVAVLPTGERVDVAPPQRFRPLDDVPEPELPPRPPDGATRRAPLGLIAGARSGDKGGDANVGVWVRDARAWPWLAHTLTVERVRELLPETARLPVRRHVLPNLMAVNLVVEGLLGQGVAANARFDPQAKALGEWRRSRVVDIPVELLP